MAREVRLPCIKVDNGRLQCTFTLLRTDCKGWQTPWCGCDGSATITGNTIRPPNVGRTVRVRLGHGTRARIWKGTVLQALPAPSALELALPAKRAHSETTVRCVLYMFAYTCMYGHVLCNCQDVLYI